MRRVTKVIAGAIAATGAAVLAAGPVLADLSVTNGARGDLDRRVHIKTHPRQATEVVVANVNLPETGDIVNWHTHPGPTIGVVTGGGTLTVVTEDCVAYEYETGEAFIAPEDVHTARNLSTGEVVIRATFIVPAGAPATVLEAPETIAELDEKCGF